ncbi:GNAT family N-acetyltransferase [Paradevosia shaoguanensis]|uniref:GNAT family N-acetyltransferase n=1 Tax=Paradevosia shaoguanensis TaxID=1335043 RepID=A0AA41UE67_9HYPH|nr:GNAT family N-acetyltransferase [Paradevosia shaoguanensis]MCF1743616.1 GNAT family N-acetyltransferase [Paradevosia shaoguanensis]MCI0128099.1 GNAT family N-acetyltransferase [Paradevosia shaoguanensis]
MAGGEIEIAWCRDPGMADAIALFFVENADPTYISHGEIMFGRAVALGQWADDLFEQVAREAREAIDDPAEAFAVARLDGELVGLVEIHFDDRYHFAVINDLMISRTARGAGLGKRFIDWVEEQCRERGIRRLFLESGIGNARAHEFFEREGFVKTAVTMMREL